MIRELNFAPLYKHHAIHQPQSTLDGMLALEQGLMRRNVRNILSFRDDLGIPLTDFIDPLLLVEQDVDMLAQSAGPMYHQTDPRAKSRNYTIFVAPSHTTLELKNPARNQYVGAPLFLPKVASQKCFQPKQISRARTLHQLPISKRDKTRQRPKIHWAWKAETRERT